MKAYTLLLGLVLTSSFAHATTVSSCDRQLNFTKPPERAVSHDINLTEMMFALGLQDRMVGYSGISGYLKLTDKFKQQAGNLPQLAEKTPSIENLLAVNADFFFAGWNYGMRPGGPLTPHTLKPFDISVYELTESCIHIMSKKAANFSDVYNDLLNLGTIFGVEEKAKSLVESLKAEIADIASITANKEKPVSVFLYDSGQDAPFTAGAFAIPNAMIEAAGGVNIVNDLPSSWAKTNWETVAERNPEVIVIVDYGKTTAAQKIAFLQQHPGLSHVSAIKNQRFVTIDYAEATPGIKNVAATRKLAEAFHPALFRSKPER
ncbi:Vitamin B12-binding protein [BD1-7 clade bacterium]|uniref:Vitamin B12-binding protein n=1 Tax=BD1-7 clade bacterium TaxID=2029982 RepID=A0A5S9N5V6_9GAMM|nr:Vitamin B12-binding protein [BD1-7 clade bacterium]